MCGVTGFVKTGKHVTEYQSGVVRETLAGIEERGPHASGYAVWDGRQVAAGKGPIPSSLLARDKRLRRLIPKAQLMIGHARWATHGDWTDNVNNHPFWSDDKRWMLVHNGVLLDSDLADVPTDGQCDSERMLRLIERDGIRAAWRRIAREVRGGYVVLVLDAQGRLYVFKNSGRPVVWADLHMQIGGLMLASTAEILRRAARRANVYVTGVHQLRPDTLYAFRPGYRTPRVIERHRRSKHDELSFWIREEAE